MKDEQRVNVLARIRRILVAIRKAEKYVVVVFVAVVALLAFGNPQWHRLFYQAQTDIFTTNIIPEDLMPPKHYTGTWTQWQHYPRTFRTKTFECENGELHGRVVIYHWNGVKADEFFVVDGLMNGRSLAWDEQGNLIADGLFIMGKPWEGTFTLLPFVSRPSISISDMGTNGRYAAYLDQVKEYRQGKQVMKPNQADECTQ